MKKTKVEKAIKVAVVTGANKGLGLAMSEELARRGYHVLMVGRRAAPLRKAAQELQKKGLAVEPVVGDVTRAATATKVATRLRRRFGKLDVLINNAGILPDTAQSSQPTLETVDFKAMARAFEVNTLGPARMLKALLPLLRKAPVARVVNVSSGMGQLSDMRGGYPAYRMSKSALNALTRSTSADFGGSKLKINCVCPGWVKTDMGGRNARRSLAEGIAGIVWAAELDEAGPSGGFFRDGKPLDW
jgi:NAD(P)-dependent dehydrogenase (short-subunit alcohol dehydrogenase family)